MSYRKFKICEALTPHIARKMKIGWALFELSALKHVIESAEIPDNACFLEKYNFGRDRRKVILQNTPEGVVLIVDIDQFEGSIYYRQCGQQKSVLITIPRYKGKQRNIEFASPYFNLKHKEPDMGMEFDKSKILTAVTADQAKVGAMGWYADTISKMKRTIQNDRPRELAHVGGEDKVTRFYLKGCDLGWQLFYPVPYSHQQEQWLKRSGLKVGDKVRVTESWDRDENGFRGLYVTHFLGEVGRVVAINDNDIIIQAKEFQARVPYFAIEKVKEPEYRPFASAEEFAPHRDEWLNENGLAYRAIAYDDRGIRAIDEYITYERLLTRCVFADTGEPAGVKK